jgi:hypothetical protein
LRSCQLCSHSRTSQHSMEHEGSLPCSQDPSTGPHPEPDRPSPYHPILSYLRSILILTTHLCLGLPSGLFSSAFPTNILYSFRFSQICATRPAHLIVHSNYVWRGVQVMKLLIMQFSPIPRHFISLRTKYSP